ncbi:hypothetical protein L915_14439 [Phytophthora nicotianae]|uniref:Uncharacterized protein n=1 Tax=Phytophthora nicotianae TaxID=4792 RepID=W2GBT1_PHYNI|nr:hypothetical protein L915_14439 [Phytophthora nicotianae]
MPATSALPRTTELTHQPLSSDEPKLANEFVEQQNDILAHVRRHCKQLKTVWPNTMIATDKPKNWL